MNKVDGELVAARLTLIRELITDLVTLGQTMAGDLAADRIRRHDTERILTQMVELAVSVNSHIAAAVLGRGPGSYRESFTDLARAGVITEQFAAQLAPSAGLRNILAHEYVAIDLQLVAAAIPAAISDYTAYVKAVATWLVDR